MIIVHTRAMLNSAIEGLLDKVETCEDPIFDLHIPVNCPGVPPEVLNPRNTWKDKEAYDKESKKLAIMFYNNFEQFSDIVSGEVNLAGQKIVGQ